MTILEKLPPVRGRYREQVPLADQTWFRVGGAAEVVFKPADIDDLAHFLKELAKDSVPSTGANSQNDAPKSHPAGVQRRAGSIPVTILGAASNIVVRDGGIEGVVIRLGRGFAGLGMEKGLVVAGAANLDVNVAQFALQQSLTGLEFLSGIPGAIGGALRMNAGAYGTEIKDVLVKAELVTPSGEVQLLHADELGFRYRHCSLPDGVIFTKAWLRAEPGDASAIAARMAEIARARQDSQPVRARTGGSTFRNPPGHKAWELIDAAQLRGMMIGGAQLSEKHCNFLINTGSATAADLEALTQRIIRQVKESSGIELEPEIRFIGKG